MKNLFFGALVALLISSCSSTPESYNITPEGVGPIKIGMNIKDVPSVVEGLYDHIEVVTTPESYDEMNDETIPAYDTYNFMLGAETMFCTVPSSEGVISCIRSVSPTLSYNGIYAGMSCREVLVSQKAKLTAWGTYASGEFYCCFSSDVPNIEFIVPLNNGGFFSDSSFDKLLKLSIENSGDSYESYELNIAPEDIREDATITEIQIR